MRVKKATKRVEEAKAKAIRGLEIQKESFEIDALAQDACVVVLEDLMKHIRRERPDFDATFLEKSLEEQRKELHRLFEAVEVSISPTEEDVENDASIPQDPQPPKMLVIMFIVLL